MYGAIYRFFTILLMYIYWKATKGQVKILLKRSLQHILSTIILIYLPRYFFLIFLACSRKPFSKTSPHLEISPLIRIANQLFVSVWHKFSMKGHGAKVGPRHRDLGPRDPETRDAGPPSKFKSGHWDSPKV